MRRGQAGVSGGSGQAGAAGRQGEARPAAVGRRAVLAGGAALAAGCGERRPAASGKASGEPPPPPRVKQPGDLLPGGLDAMVRIDLERLRAVAASASLDPARDPVGRRLRGGEEATLLDLLRLRAQQVWVGTRGLPLEADRLDAVLVARGRFARFDPTAGDAWRRQPSGHPGQAVFERTGAPRRSDPSLLAIVDGETLVLATTLEAEGVRQRLDHGPSGSSTLEVPSEGVVGAVVRPPSLVRALGAYPNLAAVAQEIDQLRAVGDLDSSGALRLDVTIGARSEGGAGRLERVARGWKDALGAEDKPGWRLVAAATAVERDGPRSLALRLRAQGEQARQLLALVAG